MGGTISPLPLLRAAHARLGLPIALSEVHVIGTERERARWLLQRLDDALALRAAGVPVVALGAWAAFGMIDWSSLLCRSERRIEDGVFTFAGPGRTPRRTLVADVLRDLAAGRVPVKPPEAAWWERDPRGERRLTFGPLQRCRPGDPVSHGRSLASTRLPASS